jgi:aryl-alcohol dehydrogenase (NADP+)
MTQEIYKGMTYTNLGKTGLKVSRLCLGMMTYGSKQWREWILEESEARPFVRAAVEAGINFFDTADMYSLGVSEEITGKLLKEYAGSRDEYVVATKVHHAMGPHPNQKGLSRKHIMDSIDGSLRRLKLDYVDLYQIHRWDYETPIEETLDALNDVVRAGKVRYLGASSMWAWQFAKALYFAEKHGWARFVSMQNQYNLVYREEEREMNPLCVAEGIGLIPWSPMARGFLAGNRTRERQGESETLRSKTDTYAHRLYYGDQDWTISDRVGEIATKLGVTRSQVALAWVLHKPGVVSPIMGVSKLYQLEEAIGALSVKLEPADIAYLEAPYLPQPVKDHQ